MTGTLVRRPAAAVAIGLAAALLQGCVVAGGGYGYEGGTGYGLDYYEPDYVPYGGWGLGYEVAPFRHGDHHPEARAGRPPPYRPSPASRAMPSIPTGSRPGGGGHGAGGHGGGEPSGGHR